MKDLDRPRQFWFERRNDSAVDLFWGRVLVTAAISYRWGSVVDLIFFVFSLMIVAAALSRLVLP